jgi:membrane fusion protein, copper/silver efflux system
MNKSNISLVGFIAGALVVAVASHYATLIYMDKKVSTGGQDDAVSKIEPLHWVAPMDPNYKRDKPGKSPMGMDLIPVYADGEASSDSGPGTIRIAPEVVNNLGVRTASAQSRPLHTMIRTVGYVQYDQDRLIHIHPRVQGWVETLHVKAAGDPVAKGQPLYELYSPGLVNAQEELLLALNRKNGRLIQAAEDRLRALQLSTDVIGELRQTGEVQQTVTFYAPQAGVVDNLNIREGFFVQPGTTLMSIGSLEDVWVEAEVFERQATLVTVGMPVTMTLEYLPGRNWRGKVDYVYPSLDEKTRTLRVRLRFKNPDGVLQPNMFAQVVLHGTDQRNTLIVPREAVIRTGSQDRVVLSLGEGRFKSIDVKLGRLDEKEAEILEGLEEGETVVTSAHFLLDSESSKTSDFKRMEPGIGEQPESVWVQSTITGSMSGHRMITARHDAIPEWEWPSMSMDFLVDESLDFQALEPGLTLHLELTRQNDDQVNITNMHIPDEKSEAQNDSASAIQSATVNGIINHIDREAQTINISREAILKWSRPASTMDFAIGESVDIDRFNKGDEVVFEFEIHDGSFVIVRMHHTNSVDANEHANH